MPREEVLVRAIADAKPTKEALLPRSDEEEAGGLSIASRPVAFMAIISIGPPYGSLPCMRLVSLAISL